MPKQRSLFQSSNGQCRGGPFRNGQLRAPCNFDLGRICFLLMLSLVAALPLTAEDSFKPFRLKTLYGKEKTLADFSNKAVLISFFFPTCPYCNQSFPEVQRLYDKYRDQGLSAVWINVLPQQNYRIPEWCKQHSFSVPVLLARNPASVALDYQVKATPTHFLLDKDGKVLLHFVGYSTRDADLLERRIEEELGLIPKATDEPLPARASLSASERSASMSYIEGTQITVQRDGNVVVERNAGSSPPRPPADLPGRPRLTKPAPQPTMTLEERVAEHPTSIAEGKLQRFDCLGKSAELSILSEGKRLTFAITDPDAVSITGQGSSTVDFSCGMQTPVPLVIKYEPTENKALGTIGNVKSIEFK